MSLVSVIQKLNSKQDLNEEDLSIIVHNFDQKTPKDEVIKNLIIAWGAKGETPFEIKILADLIISKQNLIKVKDETLDICGTGADKLNTFNVSTLSAIVASSLGVKVIKHCGSRTTSISGSVDILNEFGVFIDSPVELKEIAFQKSSLMFVSSEYLRKVFGVVKRIAKKEDIPCFVNLLGPLTNPYLISYHILGIYNFELARLFSSILTLQRSEKETLIVTCKVRNDLYMDELSFCGDNYLWQIKNGVVIKEFVISPYELGENLESIDVLTIKDMNESKNNFQNILKGTLNGPALKVVALNAGAGLYLAKRVKSINEGYNLALRHIHSGRVWEHFLNFTNLTKENIMKS